MTPEDKKTAVLDGLAQFGIVLQPEFRLDAPHALDMLYAAIYSALAARTRADSRATGPAESDKKERSKKGKRPDADAEESPSASFSEDAPQRGHISGARAEQLLKSSRLQSYYRR